MKAGQIDTSSHPHPRKNYPQKSLNHYSVTKNNEQHQFDLLYIFHNVFEGNLYKYISASAEAASSCKVVRSLRPISNWGCLCFVRNI